MFTIRDTTKYIKINSSFKRILLTFFVLLSFSISMWAMTYTWTGGGADSNWTTPGNWNVGTNYPGYATNDVANLDGSLTTTSVTLNSNITISSLNLNTNGSNPITINTNSYTLKTDDCLIVHTADGNYYTNITITGAGIIETAGFDFPGEKKDGNSNIITINENATFKITGNYYGNADVTETLKFEGTGTLYIPASGSNLDYGACGISYANTLTILPYGSPDAYKLVISGLNVFPTSNITISINRSEINGSTVEVKYPYDYSVTTSSGASFKFNSNTYSANSSGSSFFTIGNNVTSKDYDIECTNNASLTEGEGITITIYTPDKALILGTISYYKGIPVWTGATDTNWATLGNWSGITNISEVTTDTAAEITINAGVTNYPVISSDVSIKSLTITSNANVSMSGGTLTLSDLSCSGNSKFTATGGTVEFTGTSSWTATYPTNSNFNNVNIASGATLTANSDMTINGTLTNNSTSLVTLQNAKIVNLTTTQDTTISCKDISITGTSDLNSGSGNLTINSTGKATSASQYTTTGTLTISAANGITLNNSTGNKAAKFKLSTTSGNITYYNGEVSVADGITNTGTGYVLLQSSTAISQTGSSSEINCSNLALLGTGSYTLDNSNNTITTLASSGNGNRIVTNKTGTALTIGTIGSYSGIDNASVLTLTSQTGIVVSKNITSTGIQTYKGPVSFTDSATITVPSVTDDTQGILFEGDFTETNGSLIGNSTTNPFIEFTGSNITLSTFTVNDDTLKLTGTSAQSISTAVSIANIELSNSSGVTATSEIIAETVKITSGSFTLGGNLTANSLSINSGATLVAGTNSTDDINVAGDLTASGTINGAKALTVSGTATVSAAVGGTTALTSFEVTGASTLGANITTTGAQKYTGAVALDTDVTLLAGVNTVTFGNTVNSVSGETNSLTIGNDTNATKVSFGGVVGGTVPLSSVSVKGASTFGANITTTNTQTYNGTVTLGANATLIANSTPSATGGTASTVTFNGNISGGVSGSEKSLIIGNGSGTTTTAATKVVFGDGTNTAAISDLSKLTVYGESSVKSGYTVNAILLQTYIGDVTNYGTIQASGTGGGSSGENIHIRGNYTATDGTNKGSLIGSISYCVRFEQTDADIHIKMGDYTHNSGTICFFGTGTGDTYFEPGDNEYNFLYCRKTGSGSELIFAATAIGTNDQSLKQNLSTGGLYVENGTVQFGKEKLVLRALSVADGAKFIQTGSNGDDNGSDSLTTLQRVGTITAGGANSVTWDSTNQGGSLYLYGNANITNETVCSFGNKKVYTKATLTLSGAFYDLIIPSGGKVTNYTSGQIRVRHDFTIQSGGTYVHNDRPLIIGNTESTSDSVTGGIITDSSSTPQNLGSVTVRATSGQTKVFASNIQTGTLTVANGTLKAGSNSTDTYTLNVSGNLEFTAGVFIANKSTVNLNGTAIQTFTTNAQNFYNLTLAATGTTAVTTTGNLTVTGALTVNTGRTLDLATNNSALTVSGKTTNTGTINGSTAVSSPSAITFNGEYDGSSGILSASSGNTVFSSTPITFNPATSSFTANGGTVKFTGNMAQSFNAAAQILNNVSFENTYSSTGTTLTDSFIATGNVSIATGAFLSAGANTITLNGGNWSNGGTFNYGTGKISITANCTLSGSSTFYNFECITAGKTLTFTAGTTQTIASGGSLDIEGTSGNLVTLKSSTDGTAWTLTSSGTNTFNYVDVKDSTNTSSGYFTAKNSTDSGNNIKWNFFGQVYTWVGGNAGNETSWITKQNWSPASVPGTNSVITIPSGKTYYPILTAALDIVDTTTPTGAQASITIESGATFDCAGKNIKASKLTNNGTLRFTGVTGQTATLTTKDNGTGLVEYYGTTIATAPWGTDYYKLKFPSGAKGAISTELNVSATTTIVTGTGNDIELSSTDNTFTGNLSITSGGAVKLSSDGSLKIAGGASCDSLEVIGDAILNGTITTTGTASQTYKDDVSLGADTTLIAGTNTVKFDGTVNGSNSLTIGDDTHATSVTFNGNVGVAPVIPTTPIGALKVFGNLSTGASVTALTSNSTITVTGTTSLGATGETTITSSGDQTYTGKVTLSSATSNATSFVAYDGSTGKTVTFKNTVGNSTAQNLTIGAAGKASNAVFEVTTGETGALLNTVTVYGGTTFGKTLGSAVTITTSGAQVYTGASTFAVDTTLTSTLTLGNALTFGKVDASSDGGQSLTVTTGSSTGKINFNEAVGSTFALGDITTNGIVSFAKDFTQNTTKTFKVDSGSISVGVNRFVVGALQIDNGTTFTQTGSNDAQTDSAATANYQYVKSLENNGNCSWDSGNTGGYLTLSGDISGTNNADVSFGHKNVTLKASLILSGIFYDLTIPNLVTITNGNGISVQRNLAIESGGAYTHNSKTLTLGGTDSADGTISDNNTTANNLGTVTITQGTTTKTFNTAIKANTLTMSNTTANAGSITFNGFLTAATLTNGVSTNFAITLNDGATITNTVTFNTTGTVTLGDGGATGASADTITFNDGVIHTTGTTKLACALVTSDDTVEFGSVVSPVKGIELTAETSITTKNSSGGTVTLNGAITNATTSRALTIDAGIGVVLFGSTVGSGATPLGDLDVTSSTSITANNTIQSTKIDLSGGTVDLNGAVTATNSFESTGTTFNNTGATITTTNSAITINHTGAVTVAAALSSGAGKITIVGSGTTSPVAISGTLNSTTGDIDIDSAYSLGISNNITSTTGNVTIDSNDVATLSNAADITTTIGSITFGANKSGALTTAGNITTSGVEAIPSGTVTFTRSTTLTGNIVITTNNSSVGGKVLFSSTLDSDSTNRNLTINTGTGSVTFTDKVGATKQIGTTLITCGACTMNNTVKVSSISLTNSGLFLTKEDADITLTSGNFSQTSGGANSAVQLAGGIITTGASTISFANDVYLYGSTDGTDTAMTLGGASGSIAIGNPSNTKNLHIAASSDSKVIKINSPLTANNIILYGGNLTLSETNSSITSTSDIILLGSLYNVDDNVTTESPSNVSGLFSYNNTLRSGNTKISSYTEGFKTVCPDNTTTIPPDSATPTFCGKVSVASGKNITVGKNFYANGIVLAGTSTWNLNIPDNNNSISSFAEAYNSSVSYCNVQNTTTGGTHAYVSAAENCTDNGNNSGWSFERPLLKLNNIYTVYDDTIFVEFVDESGNDILIENTNNEINTAINNIKCDDGSIEFTEAFTDAACTISTNGKGDLHSFYIKTDSSATSRWNTDATGMSSGDTQSTDRGRLGVEATHKNIKPNLQIPKALTTVYASLRDSTKNRIRHYYNGTADVTGDTGKIFGNVQDKCSPVLVAVYTGQELHNTEATPTDQKEYDSHNFMEFVFSEEVDINSIATSDVNIKATDDIGAIENLTTGFEIKGLAKVANGKVNCGSISSTKTNYLSQDNYTHSLYRDFTTDVTTGTVNQTHRIRLSIAGYVDGTVTVNSVNYHYWPGFIDEAICPTGNITRITNNQIKDLVGNIIDVNTERELPQLVIKDDLIENKLYSKWDTSFPTFAKYLGYDEWMNGSTKTTSEILCHDTSDDTKVDQLQLHFFDDTYQFDGTETYKWTTKLGWNDMSTNVVKVNAQDIIGGSRPFTNGSSITSDNTTSGGIRMSSLINSIGGFTYQSKSSGVDSQLKLFDSTVNINQSVSLLTFFASTNNQTTAPSYDSLYLTLSLKTSDRELYPIKNYFEIKYNSYSDENLNGGIITDLAGNRMKSIIVTTIDRTPPRFSLTLAPVGTNQLYVVFSKQLLTTSEALSIIPSQLELTDSLGNTIDSSIIAIDTTKSAKKVDDTETGTGLIVYLTKNVTLQNILNLRLRVKKPTETSPDAITGLQDYIPQIYDNKIEKNSMEWHHAHTFSDLGINVIEPLYAFDNKDAILDKDTLVSGEWVVRDFTGTTNNSGRLYTDKDIDIVAQSPFVSGETNLTYPLTMFTDVNPDSNSFPNIFNENTASDLKIWLPQVLSALSTTANTKAKSIDEQTDSENATLHSFTIPNSSENENSFNWKDNSKVEFLFSLGGNTKLIDNDADGVLDMPLYLFRLEDSSDITSLDVWHFTLSDLQRQRGGVTILNNVINVNNAEETIIEVNMKQEGLLNVQILTLDGDVVKNLQRGRTSQGYHYYRWDGTNKSGKAVARGMYFVRVVGPGIDETRKVMAVKD